VLDRYIGYYKPYATSHDELDRDTAVQEEVRKMALAAVPKMTAIRASEVQTPDNNIKSPGPT
jgi:hypothetical protein